MATPIGPQNISILKGVVGVLTSAPLIQRWTASTAYAAGSQVLNFNPSPAAGENPWSVYICATAGNSAATGGPTGTGNAIADGTNITGTTSAASTAGSTTVTFTSVPAGVLVGMLVTDTTASAAIPAGTTVIAKTTTTITLSNAIVSPGVGSGDTITFPAAVWNYAPFSDVGEVEEFKTKINDTRAEYFTNRSSAVTLVASIVTGRVAEMSAKLKEITVENLALCGMGSMGGTAPHRWFKQGDVTPTNFAWQFLGKNAVGNKFQLIIPRCQIVPGEMSWVGKELADLPISGKNFGVDNDAYAFGYGAELNF